MDDSAKSNVNVTQPSTSEESVAVAEKKSFDIKQGEENVEERTTKRSSVVRVECAKSYHDAEPSTSGEAAAEKKTLKAQRSVRWSKRLSIDTVQWENNEGEEVLKTVKSNEKEGDIEEEEGEENVVEYTTKRSSVVRGFDTAESNNDAEPSTSEESVANEKKTIKTVTTQNSQVFFMIGCQRSGSNWLRTMLSEREDLIAPHPPHIMRDFMPKLDRYGDLSVQKNLKVSCVHAFFEAKMS